MRSQAIINILFLTFSVIFELYAPGYEYVTEVKNCEIFMRYDRISNELCINNDRYDLSECEVIETFNNKLIIWDVTFWIILCVLIISLNIQCLKYSLIKQHKLIFQMTIIYFTYFMISEILCLIIPNLYDDIIHELNLFLSGTIVLLMLFIILTYKSLKNDNKDEG